MRSKAVIIKPNEQTDSNKLNDQYRRNAYDIVELYRSNISISSDIQAQALLQPVAIDAIESQISNLEQTLATLASGKTILSFYDDDNIMFPSSLRETDLCTYQHIFGEAVLPIANTDVEYHFIDPSTGQKILIQNVKDYVKGYITHNRFKPKVEKLFENAIENVVDQTTQKGHVSRVWTKNMGINDITMVYNLDMEEVRKINVVKVYPSPELSCSIEDVSITTGSGIKQVVKNIYDEDYTFPITNARKNVFRFTPIEVTALSVQIKTANYNTIDNIGTKEFIVGSRLITLEEVAYLNQGFIGVKIEKPEGKTKIGKIEATYDGYAENIDIFVYDSEIEFNAVSNATIMTGNATTIQNVINVDLDTDFAYILFKLSIQSNENTPILKGCVITWQ